MNFKRKGYGIDLLIQASKFLESSSNSDYDSDDVLAPDNSNVLYSYPDRPDNNFTTYHDDSDIQEISSPGKHRYSSHQGASFKESVAYEEMDNSNNHKNKFMPIPPPLYREYNSAQSFLKFRSRFDLHSSMPNHYNLPNIRGAREPRCTHNELEKNRRAHLRRRMEILRDHLPMDSETVSRLTMLTVLTKANGFMKDLDRNNKGLISQKISSQAKNEQLIQKRDALKKKQHRLAMKYGIRNLAVMSALSPSTNKSFVSWRVRNQSNVSNASSSSNGSEADDSEIEHYLMNYQGISMDSQDQRDSGYDSPSFEYNPFDLLHPTSRMSVTTELS